MNDMNMEENVQLDPKKLFVQNIEWSVRDEELGNFFSQYGEVVEAKVAMDKFKPGRSRGFGFVTFADESSAAAAVEQANGADLKERQLSVQLARVSERKPRFERNDQANY